MGALFSIYYINNTNEIVYCVFACACVCVDIQLMRPPTNNLPHKA